jgi:hypothetical protein
LRSDCLRQENKEARSRRKNQLSKKAAAEKRNQRQKKEAFQEKEALRERRRQKKESLRERKKWLKKIAEDQEKKENSSARKGRKRIIIYGGKQVAGNIAGFRFIAPASGPMHVSGTHGDSTQPPPEIQRLLYKLNY